MVSKVMEKTLTELFNQLLELTTWLDGECPSVAPPLDPYDNSDLSHNFTSQLRDRLNEIKKLRERVIIENQKMS